VKKFHRNPRAGSTNGPYVLKQDDVKDGSQKWHLESLWCWIIQKEVRKTLQMMTDDAAKRMFSICTS